MAKDTMHVGFRFPTKTVILLRKICEARGEDVSDFIRRATQKELARLNYLTPEKRKALGI